MRFSNSFRAHNEKHKLSVSKLFKITLFLQQFLIGSFIKVFSLFTVVKFRNDPCVSGSLGNGTCYTKYGLSCVQAKRYIFCLALFVLRCPELVRKSCQLGRQLSHAPKTLKIGSTFNLFNQRRLGSK